MAFHLAAASKFMSGDCSHTDDVIQDPPNDSKLTYVWEQCLFHYVSEGGFTYLVMADDSVGRQATDNGYKTASHLYFGLIGGCHLLS
jgi:hypothetical protein